MVTKQEDSNQYTAELLHEIRNPLTTVKGFLQLLKPKLSTQCDKQYLQLALEELERCNDMISEYLSVSTKQGNLHDLTHTNVHDAIDEVIALLKPLAYKHSCHIQKTFSNESPFVFIEKQKLKQVLFNLLKNGLEAMTQVTQERKLLIEVKNLPSKVEVHITDTGCGMDEDALINLFTPFKTSKKYGTGLGLIVCRNIVESYNGAIFVNSQQNRGTTMMLELPCVISDITCQSIVK